VSALLITAISGCPSAPERSGIANATAAATLDDAQMENLVRRSYQYVAMYNTNNNFAMQEANPFSTNGWNKHGHGDPEAQQRHSLPDRDAGHA
jgi:hypothetical protein